MRHPDHESLSPVMDGEWYELDASRCIVEICADEALRAKWARYHLARDAMRRERLDAASLSLAERVRAALHEEPCYSNVTAIGAAAPSPDDGGPRAAEPPPTAAIAPDAVANAEVTEDGSLDAGAPGRDTAASAGESGRGARAGWPLTAFAGFGIAASAALVTVLGLNVWQGEVPSGTPVTVATAPEANDGANTGANTGATPGTTPTAADGEGALVPAPDAAGVARSIEALPAPADGIFARRLPGAPLPEVEFVANTGAYWTSPDSSTRRVGSEERLNMFLSQHIENSPTAERQGMLPYSRLVGYDERAAVR